MDTNIKYTLHINNFAAICQQLLFNSVYMYSGKMEDWYKDCINNKEDILAISTAQNTEGNYIGACVLLKTIDKEVNTDIGVYVLKHYRRNKIGTELVKMIKYINANPLPWTGSNEAEQFYNSVL